MRVFVAVALALVANAIPFLGLFGLGWTPATTLAVYWCESMLAGAFVLARMVVHWTLTHKRGYYRGQIGDTARSPKGKERGPWTYMLAYVQGLLAGALASSIFLGLFVFAVFDDGPQVDFHDLREGLVLVGTVLVLSFGTDCAGIGERPFAWIREVVEYSLGRMAILIFTVLLGGFAFIFGRHSVSFFATFVTLKVWYEVSFALRPLRRGARPLADRWRMWVARRLGPREVQSALEDEKANAKLAQRLALEAAEDEWVRVRVEEGAKPGKRQKRRYRWQPPEGGPESAAEQT